MADPGVRRDQEQLIWPDLTLWHEVAKRVLFAELKTDTGKVTLAQQAVLASLRRADAEVAVWRPSQWGEILATIDTRARSGPRAPSETG